MPASLSMLGFSLAWACAGLVHVVTETLKSYGQLPYVSITFGSYTLSGPSSAMINEPWEEV